MMTSLIVNECSHFFPDFCYDMCVEIVQCERELCNAISTVQVYYYEPLKYSNNVNFKDLRYFISLSFVEARTFSRVYFFFSLMFPSELFRIYEQHCTILHKVQEIINDYNCDSCELLFDIYCKVFEPRGYLICLYADYLTSYPQTIKLVEVRFLEITC